MLTRHPAPQADRLLTTSPAAGGLTESSFAARYPPPPGLPAPVIADAALPLISIITPSFNQGQFIRQTLESILTQDYPNLECWVIDGGSTDDTLDIVRHFATDPRLQWISEPDAGQSDAINKGLARCRGELCAWLNSDDMLLPGSLRCMAAAWLAAGEPVLLYGLGRHIDTNGQDLGYCPGQTTHMTEDRILWIGRHTLVQPATFVPTRVFRQIGGVDLSRHYALDLDLWLRLTETLPLRYVGRDIALYRLHATSKTVTSAQKFVAEVTDILTLAAARGRLSAREARCRAELFGLRTYLMPGSVSLRLAWAGFWQGVRAQPQALPEALLIIAKALVRLAFGERLWSWARYAKARFS